MTTNSNDKNANSGDNNYLKVKNKVTKSSITTSSLNSISSVEDAQVLIETNDDNRTDVELLDNNSLGEYNENEKAWEYSIKTDIKLSIKNFKNQIYVDIRKYYNGNATKKGINLALDDFKKILQWKGLDAALAKIKSVR